MTFARIAVYGGYPRNSADICRVLSGSLVGSPCLSRAYVRDVRQTRHPCCRPEFRGATSSVRLEKYYGRPWSPAGHISIAPLHDSRRCTEDGARSKKGRFTFADGVLLGAVLGAVAGYSLYKLLKSILGLKLDNAIQAKVDILSTAGIRRPDLPDYKYDQISEHTSIENRIWVTFKDGVYDITEFVKNHPGGSEKILMSVGGSLEPFWELYSVHMTPHVLEILETLRIGNIHPDEEKEVHEETDYYGHEPKRHPALRVAVPKPFNAETPIQFIVENFYTPNDLFFVRNHLPVPKLDGNVRPDVVEISGVGIKKPLSLSLTELKRKFKVHSISSTMMCAGNRRTDMNESKPVKGIMWTVGAVSTATWTGVKLSDVLASLGVKQDSVHHVIFQGSDTDMDGSSYKASIPAETAFDPNRDVLIAFEMNGKPIPMDHGFPLRLIVPGTIGARQVKWLRRIILSETESQSFWQQKDYKTYSPSKTLETADPAKSLPVHEYPVNAAICSPVNGSTVSGKDLTIKGYALSGGGRGIIRVEVSIDGGQTWTEAILNSANQQLHRRWAWTLWEVTIQLPSSSKNLEILCKATDIAHNSQPETDLGIWNVRGLLENRWHRVKVNVD